VGSTSNSTSVQLAIVALLTVLAGSGFWRAVPRSDVLVMSAMAAITSVGIAGTVAWRRRDSLTAALFSAVGFVTSTAVVGGFRSRRGILSMETIGRGLTEGWRQLLSVHPPARPTAEVLVLVALVSWCGGHLSAELVLRSRAPAAPLVPLVLGFGCSLPFGVGGAGSLIGPAAAFGGGLLALLVLRADTRLPTAGQAAQPRGQRLAHLGRVGAVTLLAAGVTAAAAGSVPTRRAVDPRSSHVPPADPPDLDQAPVELLAELRLADKPTTFFHVETTTPLPEAQRWYLGVSDTFNGLTWPTSTSYQQIGERLPSPLVAGLRANARVTVDRNLPGRFRPVPTSVVSLDDIRLKTSSDASTIIDPTTHREVLDYHLGFIVTPAPTISSLVSAGRRPPTLLKDDCDIQALANVLTGNQAGDIDRLRGVQQQLSALFSRNDDDAPRGNRLSSLHVLVDRLKASRPDIGQSVSGACAEPEGAKGAARPVSTPEQLSALFTLIAQREGFMSRLAVGFTTPPQEPSSSGIDFGRGSATAWPEVYFQGFGWIPFPIDTERGASDDPPPPTTTTTAPSAVSEPSLPSNGTSGSSNGPGPGGNQSDVSRLLLTAATALVILVGLAGLPLSVWVAKSRRTARRRRSGDEADRMLGAWHDVLDRLVERRIEPPPSLAATAIGPFVAPILGHDIADDLAALGWVANRAAFGEGAQAEGDAAWARRDRIASSLRHRNGLLGALRAATSPWPLVRRDWRPGGRSLRRLLLRRPAHRVSARDGLGYRR